MITTLKEYENGGKIDVYDLVNQNASDFDNVFACCEYFAQQGKYVLITPSFSGDVFRNPDYLLIYASLMGTPYWGKCPDFLVDGVWYEHEGYDEEKDLSNGKKGVSTLCKMLTRGLKQSSRVVLEDCGVTIRYIKRNVHNRIHRYKQKIDEVYLRTSAGLKLIYTCAEKSLSV